MNQRDRLVRHLDKTLLLKEECSDFARLYERVQRAPGLLARNDDSLRRAVEAVRDAAAEALGMWDE